MPQRIASECIRFALFWGTFIGTVTAVHEVIGMPPVLTSEPQDVVVFQQDTMLACAADGSPEPTIRWFRGPDPMPEELSQALIQEDGSLLLANITVDLPATRDGTPYYCTATNIIGQGNASVIVRSRTAIVTLAFFDGFDDTIQSNIPVSFFEGINSGGAPSLSDVALECGVQGASPPPNIAWFRGSDVMTAGTQIPDMPNDRFFFLDNGRYLFIENLEITDIDSIQYQCGVTNALMDQEMRSPVIYTLNQTNFTLDQLVTYKEIGTVAGLVGGTATFSFVGAVNNAEQNNLFIISYISPVDGTSLTVSQTGVVGSVASIPSALSGGSFDIIGTAVGAGLSVNIDGTLHVFNPAQATRAPDMDLRELIAEEEEVTLTCQVDGDPNPELLWYYNGAPVANPGVSIADNTLTIPSPIVSHTGIYQCFVRNNFGDDSVTWVLEIREPVAPQILSPLSSIPGSAPDRREGILVVVDDPLVPLTVTLEVIADPCPSVTWMLNGVEVVTTAGLYTVMDPCSSNPARGSAIPFFIVFPNVTAMNTGSYMATFDNFHGTATSGRLLVTPVVPFTFESVSLVIEDFPDATCLLDGTDATITCNVEGFPRPEIDFLIGGVLVQPGTQGFESVTRIEADQIFVEDLQQSDGGSYGCRVANDSTAPITQRQYIYCTAPGISTLSVQPAEIVEGVGFTITCVATGIPDPDITWMEEGSILVPSEELRIVELVGMPGTSLVETSNAVVDFSGRYECVARTPASIVSRSILVEVGELVGAAPPSPSRLSTESAVAVTAAVFSVVFLLIGIVLGALTYHCVTHKRSQYDMNDSSEYYTDAQTPVPVYDFISEGKESPMAMELSENVAYGPARH